MGTAWILTKEKWLDDIKWLDLLKLKFSVGQQGNDRIDDFLYVDTYNINNSNNELSLGFSRKGNKNITWGNQYKYKFRYRIRTIKRQIKW
mgnify:CR=1 FL=1